MNNGTSAKIYFIISSCFVCLFLGGERISLHFFLPNWLIICWFNYKILKVWCMHIYDIFLKRE